MNKFRYFMKSWDHPWRQGTVPMEQDSYTYEERCHRIYLLLEENAPYPILRNEMKALDRTFQGEKAERRLMLSVFGRIREGVHD